MSSPENAPLAASQDNTFVQAGWEAALRELQHQATHLEARGALRAAVTLYDAIRIARAGGLNCEHQTRI
jgi:triphosphoribosyl-dephospho-CoA synthetase